MIPADLGRLSELLDDALALPMSERVEWLAGIQDEDARLAPMLRKLLAQSEAAGATADSLDAGPRFTVPGESNLSTEFRGGDKVGPYRLVREIGRGGMGEVWLAERHDGQLKREVALKLPVLGVRRNVLVQRFARERDILAGLVHPHIARLYDAGLGDDGQPYLALEYVDGQAIDLFCRQHALSLQSRLRLLLQVADAVAYAHGRLVLHRDLKPSNILVTAEGQVRLLDFGIAKLMEGDSAVVSALTQASGRALTLEYASPEQVRGEAIGTASDVYSLAVVAYELLCGERPYGVKRRSPAALEEAITGAEAPLASATTKDSAQRQGLIGDLDAILNKALKKSPADRYPTIDALAQDWRRHLEGHRVVARPDTLSYRAHRLLRRHRVPLTAAAVVTAAFVISIGFGATALVVLALLVGLGVALWQASKAREHARVAQTEARTSEAVQKFLVGIFRSNSGAQADPIRARQRTAKDLLDEGAARIGRDLDEAPSAKLRVLSTLAEIYGDMGQHDDRVKLREKSVVLATQIHGQGSSAELLALAELARALTIALHLPEAERVLKQAAESHERGPHDAESEIAFGLTQGLFAAHTNPADGLAANTRALQLLRLQPGAPYLPDALYQQGDLLMLLGRHREAILVLEEALRLTIQDGRLADGALANTQLVMADSHWHLGELDEAEAFFRAAIETAERYHGLQSRQLLIANVKFGQYLTHIGRASEAVGVDRIAVDILKGWPDTPDRNSVKVPTFALIANAHIQLGLLERAVEFLDEAITTDGIQPSNPQFVALAHIRRATVFIEWGRYEEAQSDLDAAREVIENRNVSNWRVAGDEAEARILLEVRRARPDAAQAASARWRAAGKLQSEDELTALRFASRVCAAQGQWAQARAHCEAALEWVKKGPSVRDVPMLTEAHLKVCLGEILCRSGEPALAIAVLNDALSVLPAALDPRRSLLLAQAYIALAQAQLGAGEYVKARRALGQGLVIASGHSQLSPHYTEPLGRLREALASP